MNAAFPDAIQLRDAGMQGGSRIFVLTHYFRYIASVGTITVPVGFRTDGASVPRIFWNLLDPWGPYFPAALVHDYLYSKASTQRGHSSRRQADEIFKEAMFNAGVPWPTRETIYRAVRLFGRRSYKKR